MPATKSYKIHCIRMAGALVLQLIHNNVDQIEEKVDKIEKINKLAENTEDKLEKNIEEKPNNLIHNDYYLISDIKEPCSFSDFGFQEVPKEQVNQMAQLKYIKLIVENNQKIQEKFQNECSFTATFCASNPEEVLTNIYERLTIERTGLISERLCDLILDASLEEQDVFNSSENIDITWLLEMPYAIWQIVKDEILRCS